jgi:hypothetical protein
VAPYARVSERAIRDVERALGEDSEKARDRLDTAFVRFEATQSAIADRVASALGKPIDETAMALGYFLTLAVWLAFDHCFEGQIDQVAVEQLSAVEQSLSLDEELRRVDPAEAVDSDDVIAMEQPHLLAFVHEHVDNALGAGTHDIDVDVVHSIYRVVLIEVLALSYAVRPPDHYPLSKDEFCA